MPDVGPILSSATYEYVKQTVRDDEESVLIGFVSSYNSNTFRGRVFCIEEKRPIPFELEESARTKAQRALLTRSQHFNDQERGSPRALIALRGQKLLSPNGKLKKLMVSKVEETL